MSANDNMEQAIELAEREHELQPIASDTVCGDDHPPCKQSPTTIRTFAEIQREWLQANWNGDNRMELMLLGNRLLLEAHLSGQYEAYGKIAGHKSAGG